MKMLSLAGQKAIVSKNSHGILFLKIHNSSFIIHNYFAIFAGNKKIMQSYKFDTRIPKDGVITLPFEPALFGRDVEITIVPKQKSTAGNVPDGYMTPEEFRAKSKASLTKILNEHGIY